MGNTAQKKAEAMLCGRRLNTAEQRHMDWPSAIHSLWTNLRSWGEGQLLLNEKPRSPSQSWLIPEGSKVYKALFLTLTHVLFKAPVSES